MTGTDWAPANFYNDKATLRQILQIESHQLSLSKSCRQPHLEHRLGESGMLIMVEFSRSAARLGATPVAALLCTM
jgi:hypothetical protein